MRNLDMFPILMICLMSLFIIFNTLNEPVYFIEPRAAFPTLTVASEEAPISPIPELVLGDTDGQADVGTGDTGQTEASERYYSVPLSEDLQNHIFEVCAGYDIDATLVIAMIEKESNYDPDVIGDNGQAFGLMQVQPRWHSERIDSLGVDDLLDPYQNIIVGVDYLAELFEKGNSVEWTLMAYNGGFAHADRHVDRGEVSEYCKDVLNTVEVLGR